MTRHRRLQGLDLFQLLEFVGPTHDAAVMLSALKPEELAANASWLYPKYWSPSSNRIVLSMHLNVIKKGSEIVLIDAGVGNFKPRPTSPSQNNINTPMLDWLRAIGCAPEDVKHVVLTHLHGDHIGWNTVLQDGRWVPTFPNATYYFPRIDWEYYSARYQAGKDPKGFGDSVIPVAEANLMTLIDPGKELLGMMPIAAPGHTPGQLMYSLHAGEETCLFAADTIHHPIQVFYPHVNSRACEDGETAQRTRLAMLNLAADTSCDVLPAHYFGPQGWKISRTAKGFDLKINKNED